MSFTRKLAQYFSAFSILVGLLVGCSKIPVDTKIAIQPLGSIDSAHVYSVERALEAYYGFEVDVLPYRPMPEHAFTEIRKPRYRADTLIAWLRDELPDGYNHVLGLTDKDISITKYKDREAGIIKDPEWKYKDFGIFGLGFRPGKSCVVSTYRLKKGRKGKKLFPERLRKIACHEIGHNLGLRHCPNENCFMRDAAESIKTIDAVDENLCADCKKILGIKSETERLH